ALTGNVRLRVAVVGAGYIADYHLAILRAIAADSSGRIEVACIVDPDRDRGSALAQKHGVERVVGSIDELATAAERVDVAHLLVPPDVHVTLTRRLLEMGIGVFVEKP